MHISGLFLLVVDLSVSVNLVLTRGISRSLPSLCVLGIP